MKRTTVLLALVALLLAPAAVQAQLAIFGGQQAWSYDGGASDTGTGGGIGYRTGILPLFDIGLDGSYYTFPEEGGNKVTSLNYAASAILGGKRERINLYAGMGKYSLPTDGVTTPTRIGVHGGVMLHLFGALSVDARMVMLKSEDGSTDTSTRIIPISLRLQF